MTALGKPGPTAADIELGKRLQQIRTAMGVSQENLAANVGVTFQQIQKYEKGINRMTAVRLNQIKEHLGVPWEYFFDNGSAGILSFFRCDDEIRSVHQLWNSITQPDIRLCLYILILAVNNAYGPTD